MSRFLLFFSEVVPYQKLYIFSRDNILPPHIKIAQNWLHDHARQSSMLRRSFTTTRYQIMKKVERGNLEKIPREIALSFQINWRIKSRDGINQYIKLHEKLI